MNVINYSLGVVWRIPGYEIEGYPGMSKVQVGRTGIKGWSFTGDTKVALGINID
jgi:hypothetical protein